MTYEQIAQMLESIGIPFAYYQFTEDTAKAPPFMVFYYPDSPDFYADNTNYVKRVTLVIELYTDYKDFDLEEKIEKMLNDNELPYNHYESYIDTEKLYMQTYESEVFING